MTSAAQIPEPAECDMDMSQLEDLAQVLPRKALQELIASFGAAFEAAYEKLEAATAMRDLNAAGHEAHDLKSITGNFGMRRLQCLAERIESACKSGDGAEVTRLVPEIAAAWSAARTLLAEFKADARG